MKCACVKEKGVNRGFHFVSDKLGPTSKMVHALKRGQKFMQHDKGKGESLETVRKSQSKAKAKVCTTA